MQNLERTCRTAGWPKSQWINILRPQLKGKAQLVFAQVSEDVASDYNRCKEALFTSYGLVPERYRERFRTIQIETDASFGDFATRVSV